jgi:prepilin signal peptidase PulO-like enzyme (type II secretory pathway)
VELAAGIVAALLGVFLGRALNSSIDRLPPARENNGQLCGGRHLFRPAELVPVLTYIWWHRSCNLCRQKIPLRAVAVEGITAIACGGLVYWYGISLASLILIFYVALFIHLAFVDLEHSLLLNVVVLPAIPLALALFPFTPLAQAQDWGIMEAYLRGLTGMGVGFGMMLVIYLVTRGGTGAGDVKLAALLGAMLGFHQIIAGLALGYILGGIAAVVLLALRIKSRKDPIPFGPALVIGTALVLLGGPGVYTWYLNLFRIGN